MVSQRELNAFMAAISGQESGGDYSARNPDSGAYGAFQIMPANWPSWAAEAGLGANAPRTQENQNKVAAFKMRQYYNKFGNWADVASAWYSGRPRSQVDLDKPQGKYPSIGEYVNQAMTRFRQNLGSDPASGGQMSQESSSAGIQNATYWTDRLKRINEEIAEYEEQRQQVQSQLDNMPGWVSDRLRPYLEGELERIDANIQNLQGLRDEAYTFSQQEKQAASDIAFTQSQIDVNRINAMVAEGRLTLDQAIHKLNEEIKRRQQALAEEQTRRTQGRADAEYISEQLNEAAAWAPQEPGKTDYTGADVSAAHGQVLSNVGISPDSTIAKYSGTRVVDPQRTLAQAGGGASGGRGSAPGMGWTDEDRAGGEPAPPDTGTGTGPSFAGNTPPPGHPASTSPGGGGQAKPGASFAGNTPPPGHPASTSPPPSPRLNSSGLLDAWGIRSEHPAFGGPTPPFSGNTPPPGHPAMLQPISPSPLDFSSLLDQSPFRNNTPPPGHPAMRRR